MPDNKISPTALSILTLLNNINDLIVKSNDREGDAVKILNFLKKNGYYELNATSTE